MNFPQTSRTLIYRIAQDGHDRDWQQFMSDYWLPVCRFAQQRAGLKPDDAEDVASETFEALYRNQLLQRWASNRSSKLRTLLCTVVRHVLGNRARVQQGRQRLLKENAHELREREDLPSIKSLDESTETVDLFFEAWVESLLFQAVEGLMQEYHRTGKGDYFRVLYGRVCEQLTVPQIGKSLGLTTAATENYYKAARKRLGTLLQEMVRRHVERYCEPPELEAEFTAEWNDVGQYLTGHGGLESVIAKVYANLNPEESVRRQKQAITTTLRRLTQRLPEVSDPQVE
jgi:RNA polymerase sigma factor (sigma-70 family)